ASASATGGSRSSSISSGGNHGRHPRQQQPSKSPQNQKQQLSRQNQGGRGGNGRRPRSSSYTTGSTPKKSSGPYTHLFCSERHAFAMSRVFYPQTNHQYLLPLNCKEERNSNHNTNIATDEQLELWWDSVKIVRCHAPFQEDATSANDSSKGSHSNYPRSFLERCPMCLDEEMVSPCIAPCGHTFCLPCVLGYLNSVAKELNTESERIGKNKQEGKGGVVGANSKAAMDNRATVTSIRARCPMCSSGSSLVLHAGEAMLTYKDLRPVVFVPVMTITASSAATIGESKKGSGGGSRRKDLGHSLGTRMRFVKLHRAKLCPAPYLPLTGHRVRGGGVVTSSTTASSMYTAEQHQQNLPDLPDGDDDREECIYTRQYFVGVNEYENILQRDLDDLQNYREKSMYCQMDPREVWNVSMAIEAIQAAQRRWIGSSIDDGGFRRMESEAKVAAGMCKQSEQLLLLPDASDEGDETNTDGLAPSQRKSKTKSSCCLQPGSFPLHQNLESNQDESEEFLYYQSSDGQHYYLSGFDVVCLTHEFSLDHNQQKSICTKATQSETTGQDDADQLLESRQSKPSRFTLPLPDEITATIVSVDQCPVTTSLIKRKPFLSHVPLHASVSFVEIDWYSGGDKCNQPLLSQSTLSKFRGELQRRKSERQRVAKLEKTADEIARAKSEKDERRRRQELLESNFYDGGDSRQTIDPGDDFFQAPAVSVDETDKPSQWNRTLTHQFSAAAATEEMWPELK
ncbi:hypothetical protein ACHAXH_005087, partial [Discostella pseudostelligera]